MKDIAIIIPVHVLEKNVEELLSEAVKSVVECQKVYTYGKLKPCIVCPQKLSSKLKTYAKGCKDTTISVISNSGDTDFCSQINFAVDNIDTEFFSILEFDDYYTKNWFKNAHDYYYGNENVSAFLPVNMFHDGKKENWQYGNTMALSPTFITTDKNDTDDIGIINHQRLEKCSLFNLTGAVINTADFKTVGKYKPSIKVAFNYEFLLRLTKKGLTAMVVPKEGYVHALGREGSLTDEYMKTTTDEEREKWFKLAIRECKYTEDRKKTVSSVKKEELK